MKTSTIPVFQNTYQKTEQWLGEIMNLLDWDDRKQAYKALRAVLHTLRDHLSVEEATDLAAQLPMLIKGESERSLRDIKTFMRKLALLTGGVSKVVSKPPK